MSSTTYLRKEAEATRNRNSERGKRGNEVKRQRMREQASKMTVVATVKTDGSLGEHLIELIDGGAPMVVWIRFDGKTYRPRTARGFVSLLGRRIWRTGIK